MKTGQVFVSHTSDMARFPETRPFVQAALDAVARTEMVPVDMRYFAARDGRPADYCRARVRGCDVYVAVVGFRYGSIVPGEGISYTELEFEEASAAGLPRLVFLMEETAALAPGLADADRGPVELFRQRLRDAGLVVRSFASGDGLELEVFHALSDLTDGSPSAAAVAEVPALTFAGLLRQLRHEAGVTQEGLARAAGVSARSVSDLERGKALTARKDTVRMLADALRLAGPVRDAFEATARGRLLAGGFAALGVAATRTLPRDIASFTGREPELRELADAATSGGSSGVGIHVIGGMAGIGKTAFAVHAAHRLAARFPGGQIFLRLHAHTAGQRPVDPADALATLLLTTGVAPQRIPPGLEARSALWRGHLAGKKVLLVLDDAAGSDQVRPLLPGSAECLVFVTSRRRLTALEEAVPISLDTLAPGEAADLFVRLAARPGLQPADGAVAEVTWLCGYLPLAIRLVAAGLCHHRAWTVSELAAELATARDRLAAMQAEDVSVAAAFDLSYRDLSSGQQRLFCRLGLHPGADIDGYAAAALDGADLQATRRRLGELYDHNLIGERTRGRYRLHDLLREHARARATLGDPAENQAAIGRLLDYYMHTAVAASRYIAWHTFIADPPLPAIRLTWPRELRTEQEAIAWLRTERLNLHACVDYAAAHSRISHALRIPVAISDFLHAEGYWDEAVALGQAAVAAAQMGNDQQGQAWALSSLGFAQGLTGDNPAATASQTQALRLFRDIGDRHGEAWALSNLGVVRRLTGDYPAAATSQTQALRLFRDIGDRHGQGFALNNLGTLQLLAGDYPAAATSQTQALQLFCDIGDLRGQGWALNNLGAVQQSTGDYPAAATTQARALQLFGDTGDRHGQGWVLNQLGIVQQLTGDYPAATASLTRALQLFRDIGDRHGQADASINLGELLSLSEGRHRDARSHYTHALSIARDIAAAFQEARALEGIGRCRIQEGNPAEGAAYLRQALGIYRRIGSPEAQRVETTLLKWRR